MPPIQVNHIAVVVEDIDTALSFWRDALGLPLSHQEDNPDEAVKIAFLPIGDSEIELLQPTTGDSGIAKYVAKKGTGLHHICIEVENIEDSISQLKAKDTELINETPRTRPDGTRYAFVHPKSTGGVLLELYELPAATR
jgi:methylmalonyl-CoA/ethylmalonyl-CoA epimerase